VSSEVKRWIEAVGGPPVINVVLLVIMLFLLIMLARQQSRIETGVAASKSIGDKVMQMVDEKFLLD
jgi:hypothetical protein